jgi:hypothetical protein
METFLITFAPIIEVVLGLLAAAVLTAGTYAIKKVADKFGIDVEGALASRLQDGLYFAVEFAQQRLAEKGKKYTIETERELVADAVNYIINSFPDTIAALGITEARLIELIEARLNAVEYDKESKRGQ